MSFHLVLLVVYSLGVVALGLWTARLVRHSSDFFVAGRSLGPGLLFATMLAANIGAGSTVGAAGVAYRDGISAWWWVGSAGLASLLFATTIAPRLWRLAKTHQFYTTGDYLEYRYDGRVRTLIALVTSFGSLALLAGQLIAGAAILNVVAGIPRWAGTVIGAAVMTIYFSAGGLLGSAWVNSLQLVVMLAGFLAALPYALDSGGYAGLTASAETPAWFGDFLYSGGPLSGWTFLVLTGPSFLISPGLIQKAYGARSEGALRLGIGMNAVALLLFAFLPVLFGMAARTSVPGITERDLVLPTFLATQLPVWLGALTLAAVFSTEVDTCDAILFMLSTTISKDVYKRHINPAASDAELLRVARITAVAGGAAGVVLSLYLGTVTDAVATFYSMIVVSLLIPIVGGLYTARPGSGAALTSIGVGLTTLFAVQFAIRPHYRMVDPVLAGLVLAAIAYAAVAWGQRGVLDAGSVHAR